MAIEVAEERSGRHNSRICRFLIGQLAVRICPDQDHVRLDGGLYLDPFHDRALYHALDRALGHVLYLSRDHVHGRDLLG